MNYNNKEAGINQSKSDIGSRIYWEPLTKATLDLIFKNKFIKQSIFNSFLKIKDTNAEWQEEYGYLVYGAANRIHMLVSTRDNRSVIKDLVHNYNTLSAQYLKIDNEDEINSTANKVQELNSEFIRRFSEIVSLCVISDYYSDMGGIQRAYFGEGPNGPLYRLESEYTQDTGTVAGINLVSIPTSYLNPYLNENSHITKTVSERDAELTPLKFGDTIARGATAARKALNTSEEDSDDRPVIDKDAKRDVSKYSTSQEEGESYKIHPGKKKRSPMIKVGGQNDALMTTEEKRNHGTHHAAYLAQGTMVNPNIESPSAFFFPNKGLIKNLFNPLSTVFENPYMLLGIIALGTQKKKSNDHSFVYNNLPTQIIDNQKLKDELTDGNI